MGRVLTDSVSHLVAPEQFPPGSRVGTTKESENRTSSGGVMMDEVTGRWRLNG